VLVRGKTSSRVCVCYECLHYIVELLVVQFMCVPVSAGSWKDFKSRVCCVCVCMRVKFSVVSLCVSISAGSWKVDGGALSTTLLWCVLPKTCYEIM
jgi:hypothetical protein